MTVKELMEALSKYSADTVVVVEDYEWGEWEVSRLSSRRTRREVDGKWVDVDGVLLKE